MSTRVLTVKRNSIPVWCFTKLFCGDIETADFCKLFWATVLAPVMMFALAWGWLLVTVGFKFPHRLWSASRKARILNVVPETADRLVGKAQDHPAIVGSFIAGVVLVFLGIWAWLALTDFLVFTGSIVGIIILGAGLCALFEYTSLGRVLSNGASAVKSRTCPRVEIGS